MLSKYLIILTTLLGIFISCSNEVNTTIKKQPCEIEGVYCRGTKLYTCHNNDNNEAVEEVLESCDNGQICFNQECVVAKCDKIINCIMGERKCNGENSYEICGNYDSDLCLEWDTRNCGENSVCNNGLCIKKEENPCNLIDCLENSTCQVNDGEAQCICNDGYELKDDACIPICVPNCENRECGDDGCGNVCGNCSETQTCNSNGKCINIDPCENIECNPEQHCDPNNGNCTDNKKLVNCNIATPIHGITDDINKQVEVTWTGDSWSEPEECPWHCDIGYYKEGHRCLEIICANNQHLEGNNCTDNEKVVQCVELTQEQLPQHAHNDIKEVTIVWDNTWPEIPNCDWLCDNEYHKYTDPNTLASSCVSDTIENVPCQTNEDLPDYAIEDTNQLVTQTWVYDDENSEEGHWITPYCEWHCDTNISCLSSDATYCVEKVNNDVCDGEDNNCDGRVDAIIDTNGNVISSSCNIGTYCSGYVWNQNHHRYLFCNAILENWQEAEIYCTTEVREGHLIAINNEAENNFMKEHIGDYKYWIGYYQNSNSGDAPWIWSNGITTTYTNWNEGEPNNSCLEKEWSWSKFKNVCVKWENCAETYSNGSWNDADCSNSRRFICEGLPGPN